jgi:hypothetical protein
MRLLVANLNCCIYPMVLMEHGNLCCVVKSVVTTRLLLSNLCYDFTQYVMVNVLVENM